MDADILDILKSNGLATALVIIALPWLGRRIDRLIDRHERHLDSLDAMKTDVTEIKSAGCGRASIKPAPPMAGAQPA